MAAEIETSAHGILTVSPQRSCARRLYLDAGDEPITDSRTEAMREWDDRFQEWEETNGDTVLRDVRVRDRQG
jgi:hypothetical protein